MVPNVIVLGSAKSGTTFLYNYFRQREDIFTPNKEIHYFTNNFHKGQKWYESHFETKTKKHLISVEVAANYLYSHDFFGTSQGVPNVDVGKRIKETIGRNVKLVCIFREPVSRAFSNYVNLLQGAIKNGLVMPHPTLLNIEQKLDDAFFSNRSKSMQRPLTAEQIKNFQVRAVFEEAIITHPYLLCRSMYSIYLAQFLTHFERKKFFFIDFEELKKDPVTILRELDQFLEIDPCDNLDVSSLGTNSVQNRNFYINPWLASRLLNLSAKNDLTGKLGMLAGNALKTDAVPKLDENVKSQLKVWFRPFNEELKRQTQLKLKRW